MGLLGPAFSLLNVLQTTESLFVLYFIDAFSKWANFLSPVISQYNMSWALLRVNSGRLKCICQISLSCIFRFVWSTREILGRAGGQNRSSSNFVAHTCH